MLYTGYTYVHIYAYMPANKCFTVPSWTLSAEGRPYAVHVSSLTGQESYRIVTGITVYSNTNPIPSWSTALRRSSHATEVIM